MHPVHAFPVALEAHSMMRKSQAESAILKSFSAQVCGGIDNIVHGTGIKRGKAMRYTRFGKTGIQMPGAFRRLYANHAIVAG